jgi:hypothetical protein
MKKTGLTLFVLLICYNIFSQNAPDEKKAFIQFEQTTFDYGEIKKASEGICEFKFTNNGNAPLILTNVRSSCGCTVPDWTKAPIQKGKTGRITVKYNTHIVGSFSKNITVYSNGSDSPIVLNIKGIVKP